MARKGFWQGGVEIAQEIDRIAASAVFAGPIVAAERVVRELQQDGPSWTGKFSNSWQISAPFNKVARGDGKPGEPRSIGFTAAPFTGRQATAILARQAILKDKVVFTISNYADHALEAIDAIEHDRQYYANRRTRAPETEFGYKKWVLLDEPRRPVSVRGQIGGGAEGADSSRTADLDWFATYASARLDKAIRIEMDSAIERRFR